MRRLLLVLLTLTICSGISHAEYVSNLVEISPTHRDFVFNVDQTSFQYGGQGFAYPVLGSITGFVELAANLGCNQSDFSGFTPGDVALIERGSCFFSTKTRNAEAAGATAFIIYDDINESITATKFGLVFPGPNVPGVMVTLNVGNLLIADLTSANAFPNSPLSVNLAVANVPEPASGSLFLLIGMLPTARWLLRKVWP